MRQQGETNVYQEVRLTGGGPRSGCNRYPGGATARRADIIRV